MTQQIFYLDLRPKSQIPKPHKGCIYSPSIAAITIDNLSTTPNETA